MSCERYAGAIVDHACGAAIAPDAAAHLGTCAACGAMFDEQQRLIRDLDEELQAALDVEPSPRFVQQVLARVEPSPVSTGPRMWWGSLAAAAAVVIIIGLGSVRFGERRTVDRPQPAAAPIASAPGAVEPGQATPPASTVPAGNRRATRVRPEQRSRTAIARRSPGQERLEVLVPPEQSLALARYLRLLRGGTLDTSNLAKEEAIGAVPPPELVVAPLVVDALSVSDLEPGLGTGVDRRGPQ